MISVKLDRPVRGELALIGLRLMRELGVRHGVPFDVINDDDRRFTLPEELQPIASRILEKALAGEALKLDADHERLLRSRYIHQSANWTPRVGAFINKPGKENRRIVHRNYPQKGYPR
jgi:type VI secretion system secreted protein VgrG